MQNAGEFYPFKAYWLRDATTTVICKNCTLYPHGIYVFCNYVSTNSDLCHLHHKLIGFLLTYLLIYSIVQIPSSEVNWFVAIQEISYISWNPKAQYHTQKLPTTFPILDQPNPVHINLSHLLEIHPNINHPSTFSPVASFPPVSPPRPFSPPLSSPIRATCPAHLILLDFISRTTLGEEYKSFSSSFCNLLNSPFISSLLGPNILLNNLF